MNVPFSRGEILENHSTGEGAPPERGFVRDFTGRIHSQEFFAVNGHSSHGYDLQRIDSAPLGRTFVFQSVPRCANDPWLWTHLCEIVIESVFLGSGGPLDTG